MKKASFAVLSATALLLAGCASGGDSASSDHSSHAETSVAATSTVATSSSAMHEHEMDGGPAPASIKVAENPKYPVGSKVTLTADHMPGMNGAEATIAGAYQTTTYVVDYTPTNGGEPVKNHKWVVQEELKDPASDPLKVGDKAVMTATHMAGMEGAEATISEVNTETVYMVDYKYDGMEMTNHKWVVESEIK